MIPSKDDIQKKMNDFRGNLKLLNLSVPNEIERLLNADRSYLKSTPREELCIDSIKLAQYSLYLKSEANRLKSNISWCEANINSIIGREVQNVDAYGVKEKSLIITRNDPVARDLEGIRTLCQTQLHSIDELDRKVDFLSSCFKNLAFERRSG